MVQDPPRLASGSWASELDSWATSKRRRLSPGPQGWCVGGYLVAVACHSLDEIQLRTQRLPKTAHTGIKSRVLQQAGPPQQVGTLLGRQALWLLNPLTVVLGKGGCPGLHPHCGSLGSGIRGPVHVRAVLGTSLATSSMVLRRLPLWGDTVHTCLAAMSL